MIKSLKYREVLMVDHLADICYNYRKPIGDFCKSRNMGVFELRKVRSWQRKMWKKRSIWRIRPALILPIESLERFISGV